MKTHLSIMALLLAAAPLGLARERLEIPGAEPVPTRKAFKNASAASSHATLPQAWWTLFDDPVLNRLEEQALTANQDLQRALSTVIEARERARATEADLFPSVSVPIEIGRRRTTGT